MIKAPVNINYESNLKDEFNQIISAISFAKQTSILKYTWLDSPLGAILSIADEKGLWLLEFIERRGLKREIECLGQKTKSQIIPGRTAVIDLVEEELASYFAGSLKIFKTPIHLLGTPFQQMVWQELMRIPYGKTESYLTEARAIGRSTSFRAVTNANGANQLAIIIPCHRIINSNGKLGGYGGGIARKEWLLNLEKSR